MSTLPSMPPDSEFSSVPTPRRSARYTRMASPGSSTVITWPWFMTMARSQFWRMVSGLWLTTTMVRPSRWIFFTWSRHLRWKAASPTDSTSSTSRTSGSTLMATANPSRTYMPDE